MSKPSAILLGSKPGSVIALSTMLERGWDIPYVVVSRKIKHEWVKDGDLETFAMSKGLPTVNRNELPRDISVDFVISYMYRYRVTADILALAKRASVNFHAGPLPEYGGWAFYNIAILENATEYGCTCHYMDEGFDTGPLLKVNRFPITASQETAATLERKAQAEMVRLFLDFCDMAESDDPLPYEEQDATKMRYLSQEEFMRLKQIPADADAETIDRHARAFWYPPYECAYSFHNGVKVEIVPEVAKSMMASLYHQTDLEYLMQASTAYKNRAR